MKEALCLVALWIICSILGGFWLSQILSAKRLKEQHRRHVEGVESKP